MSPMPIDRRPGVPRTAGLLTLLAALAAAFAPMHAQDSTAAEEPAAASLNETIQVVASKDAEPVLPQAASISVVSGEELRARGIDDLGGALALVAGVAIAPGGDGGPASSVPEMWGLREFDAFLLVVDGVPWGGAFNPALASLDVSNVERIEVMRGAAPVMYGATSFVGVIEVVHRAAGAPGRAAGVWGGNRSSGGASIYLPLGTNDGAFRQSLAIDYGQKGYKDDRTSWDKAHLLYRGSLDAAGGTFRFDFDAALIGQEPASPHPREGRVLSPNVPLDANHNPRGAKQDEDRFHFVTGYERQLAFGNWSTTLALTQTDRDIFKGFLSEIDDTVDENAAGFTQEQEQTDVYFDTHFSMPVNDQFKLIAGVDYLFGEGETEGDNFEYHANLDGSNPEGLSQFEPEEHTELEDERNFAGLYADAEWAPIERLRVNVGVRLNLTEEKREGEAEPIREEEEGEEEEGGEDTSDVSRVSGVVGVSFKAWESGQSPGDSLWIYGDYRDAFKPAAIDFGPEAEGVDILKPEEGTSLEFGIKGSHLDGRLGWQASYFDMDLENLLTAVTIDGRPALINAGSENFKGYELEGSFRILPDLVARAAYAHHEATFVDFVQEFDGVPTQLAGKRFEMSPEELWSAELAYVPKEGFTGWATYSFIGDRYLNKRNTALAEEYDTISAGAGWGFGSWRILAVGENLSDARDPVAESELGDAQYYRLPATSYELRVSFDF